jgi:hypothetical protein
MGNGKCMQFLLLNNAETLFIKWLSVNDIFSSTIKEEIFFSCDFFSLESLIFYFHSVVTLVHLSTMLSWLEFSSSIH